MNIDFTKMTRVAYEGNTFHAQAGYGFYGAGSRFVRVPLVKGLNKASNALAGDPCSGTYKALYQPTAYLKPFAPTSPWNVKPAHPVFTANAIQPSPYGWFPQVAEGSYSAAVFLAADDDQPKNVSGPNAMTRIMNSTDHWSMHDFITVPRWPAALVPATGSDGHADIADVRANVLHSFWQLKKDGDVWRAAMYSTTPLDGMGFGDATHPSAGARASGVPASAGLIRCHELNDGQPQYQHVLAMSLGGESLAKGFITPATMADGDQSPNIGSIPEGAQMMLPPTFDLSKMKNAALLKVARTLMTYGAFVVDRNYATPFVIYVEVGAGISLMPNGWDNEVAAELTLIQTALRQVH